MIPLVDVKAQYAPLIPQLNERIAEVVESGRFILGPNVAAFEAEAAAYLCVPATIGVANGTDALVLALERLHVRTENEGAGRENIGEDALQLRNQRRVLRLHVNERDRRHGVQVYSCACGAALDRPQARELLQRPRFRRTRSRGGSSCSRSRAPSRCRPG